jgi:hypothetical protein
MGKKDPKRKSIVCQIKDNFFSLIIMKGEKQKVHVT